MNCSHARTRQPSSIRLVSLVAALLIVFGLFAAFPAHQAAASSSWIDTDVLNLRDGPGVWAEVIDKMWQDEPVTVLDGPTEDGWYLIDYYGTDGWAFGGYLWVDGGPGWASEEAVGGGGDYYDSYAWVAADRLRVRASASDSAAVLDIIPYGDDVYVDGYAQGGFVPVWSNGIQGWVAEEWLTFSEPAAASAEHWIDVDRGSSTVTLYVGDEAVASYWASMGYDDSSDGFYSTAIGTWEVSGMNRGLAYTKWAKAYIKYWVMFDSSRRNGFHSYSMDSDGNVLPNGDGATGGCVALAPGAAAEVYDFAYEGMRVEVHW